MRIGFSMLYWTARVTAADAPRLAALRGAGYEGVEIPVLSGGPRDYAALGRMLDDLGLARSAFTVIQEESSNPLGADAIQRQMGLDYLRYCLDCTEALGARVLAGPIHMPHGQLPAGPARAAEGERATAFHRSVGDFAAQAGITIALEAANRYESGFLTTLDALAAHLATVDHPQIAGTYDSFHAGIEERDPVGALAALGPRLAHVHLAENDRGTPGLGTVPWAALFDALVARGYDGWLMVEAVGCQLDELPAMTRTGRSDAAPVDAVWQDGYAWVRRGRDAARARSGGGKNG